MRAAVQPSLKNFSKRQAKGSLGLKFIFVRNVSNYARQKKPPVDFQMGADAVVALWPHSLSGCHLAQLQVGGASALS